jgi:hypothetical protein
VQEGNAGVARRLSAQRLLLHRPLVNVLKSFFSC